MWAPALLVRTRTTGYRLPATGYRHDSIPAGVTALRTLGGFDVDATGDHLLQEE